MGFVYILTNPSFDEWVKIGMTKETDIQKRVDSLNSSSAVPFSFRIYATLETDKPLEIEQNIHKILDVINSDLRSKEVTEKGTPRTREFFKISAEQAFSIFEIISETAGIKNKLKRYKPTIIEQEEELESEKLSKKTKTTFKSLDIPIGAKLEYLYGEEFCIVHNEINEVEFKGSITTLSGIAKNYLNYISISGFKIFKYGSETLWQRRLRLEKGEQ